MGISVAGAVSVAVAIRARAAGDLALEATVEIIAIAGHSSALSNTIAVACALHLAEYASCTVVTRALVVYALAGITALCLTIVAAEAWVTDALTKGSTPTVAVAVHCSIAGKLTAVATKARVADTRGTIGRGHTVAAVYHKHARQASVARIARACSSQRIKDAMA